MLWHDHINFDQVTIAFERGSSEVSVNSRSLELSVRIIIWLKGVDRCSGSCMIGPRTPNRPTPTSTTTTRVTSSISDDNIDSTVKPR
jgi:hypothetical protein